MVRSPAGMNAGSAETRRQVFERVRDCMRSLVGSSGHLGSYSLDADTFEIVGETAVGDGVTEYEFAVTGSLETEFTVYDEGQPARPPDRLRGSIVLDRSYGLTRDETGRVRLRPWTVFEGL